MSKLLAVNAMLDTHLTRRYYAHTPLCEWKHPIFIFIATLHFCIIYDLLFT